MKKKIGYTIVVIVNSVFHVSVVNSLFWSIAMWHIAHALCSLQWPRKGPTPLKALIKNWTTWIKMISGTPLGLWTHFMQHWTMIRMRSNLRWDSVDVFFVRQFMLWYFRHWPDLTATVSCQIMDWVCVACKHWCFRYSNFIYVVSLIVDHWSGCIYSLNMWKLLHKWQQVNGFDLEKEGLSSGIPLRWQCPEL